MGGYNGKDPLKQRYISGTISISEFINLITDKEEIYRQPPPPIPEASNASNPSPINSSTPPPPPPPIDDIQREVEEDVIGSPVEERPLTGTRPDEQFRLC